MMSSLMSLPIDSMSADARMSERLGNQRETLLAELDDEGCHDELDAPWKGSLF